MTACVCALTRVHVDVVALRPVISPPSCPICFYLGRSFPSMRSLTEIALIDENQAKTKVFSG